MPDITVEQDCFYNGQEDDNKPVHSAVGTHQCPKCKNWYCDECYEMFLPIDNQNWQETNLMCAQCHYTTYHGF